MQWEKRKIEQGGTEEHGGSLAILCLYLWCCFKKLTLLRDNLPIMHRSFVHRGMSSDRCEGPVSLLPSEDKTSLLQEVPQDCFPVSSLSQQRQPLRAVLPFLCVYVAELHGLWDLSSPTRGQTLALSRESTES